jgi:6-phosphofructokinase
MTKRIGLLTSGGLNAVICTIALRASSAEGWEVLGIRNG